MRKHRALLVQQKVRAELDTPAHDPAEGAVVVVDGVVDEEGVVRGEGGGDRVQVGRDRALYMWHMRMLTGEPEVLEGEGGVLSRSERMTFKA